MSYPIIINRTHHTSDNNYTYRFSTNVDFNNIDIALGSVSIYYSWKNITTKYNNNSFQIIHPTTVGSDLLTITIPDGGYEIADINNYLRWYLISNGYYIQNDTTLEQRVFAELRVNASTYSIEFVSYPTIDIPVGWTAGSNYSYDGIGNGPQMVISSNNFGKVIGFNAGTYPSTASTDIETITSTSTPQITEVVNVLLSLDVIDNPYAPNSNVIHALSTAGVDYGRLITSEPNTLSFIPCQNSNRQEIRLSFVDQNLLPIEMIDYDIVCKLILKRKD